MGNQASTARTVSFHGSPTDNPSSDAIKNGHVTGLRDPAGRISQRFEIDQFCQNEDMLNLYLLALEDLQINDPPNLGSPWSWFGFGRIHGGVDGPWDRIGRTALHDSLKDVGRERQFREWTSKVVQEDPTKPMPQEVTIDYSVTTGPDYAWGYCNHGSVLL